MKLTEYLITKKRESQSDVDALEAHEKTHDAMMAEFDRLDTLCVEAARELAPLAAAGSPKAFAAQAELKTRRWKRDGVRSAWQRERNELVNRVERWTREPIYAFHERCLDRVRGLSQLYVYTRVESIRNPYTEEISVRIRHNSAALAGAQELIFRRISEVRAMQTRTLKAVEEKIAECEKEFYTLDTNTLEIEEVTESTAQLLKPVNAALESQREIFGDLSSRIKSLEGRK